MNSATGLADRQLAHPRPRHARRRRTFTLIELIVVIVVLGLLAAIAVVGFNSVITRSKLASAEATLASVGREAQALAAFDAAGSFSLANWSDAVADLPDEAVEGTAVGAGFLSALEPGEMRHGWVLVDGLWEWSGSPTTISISDPVTDAVGSALWVPGVGCAYALTPVTGNVETWSESGVDQWDCTGWAVESPGATRTYSAPPMPGCVTVVGRTVTNGCGYPVDVFVDGQHVGSVPAGGSVEFDFSGSFHVIDGSGDPEVPLGWMGGPGGTPGGPPPPPPAAGGSDDSEGSGGSGSPVGDPGGPTSSTPGGSPSAVTLSWAGSGADSYQVVAGPAGGPFSLVGTTSGTSYVHTSPNSGYVYQIIPITSGTPGDPVAPTAAVTPPPADPVVEEQPNDGVVIDVEDGVVTLSWGAVPDTEEAPLTGYRVYRQPQGVHDWTAGSVIWTGAATSTSDEPPTSHDVWCYRVSAYGPGGESGLTSTVCADVSAAAAGGAWAALSGGNKHTCGLTVDGDAYCWGYDANGELGNGAALTSDQHLPSLVDGGHKWKSIDAGATHTCGITVDDDAYCWGSSSAGQLGFGNLASSPSPTLVAGGHKWKSISTNSELSCGVTLAGDGYCWGSRAFGRIGSGGTSGNQTTPAKLSGIWDMIDTGDAYACGVRVGGAAYCWGLNSQGRLGDGTTTQRNSPTLVGGGHTWKTISAGNATCGVTTSDVGYCWGSNGNGQLGIGVSGGTRTTPTAVAGDHAWLAISSGSVNHACGVTTDEEAFCWGAGFNGRLGTGTSEQQIAPTAVAGDTNWATVDAADHWTCALTSSNEAACWGSNGNGQLGIGSTDGKLVPTPLTSPA